MLIVENESLLQDFLKTFKTEDCIVIPIQRDINKHPAKDKLSLLYVQTLKGKEFILPYNHSETLEIEIPDLVSSTKKYTFDSKKLNYFLNLENVIDVNLIHYMKKGYPLDVENITTNSHTYFNITHHRKKNINTIIPVLKHLEYCRELSTLLKDSIDSEHINLSYNDEILSNLRYIEQNGLQTEEGKLHSEYNIYTSTGRPSNRFGGTNFAALNKKDGSRKKFISRYGKDGMLIEMDYDAYHLRLIGEVVGYKFPKGSVHKHMAKLYKVDYEEAKSLSFQYLYGHIPDDVLKSNPFFKKVQVYIDEVWKRYKSNNFIESDIYNKRIYRNNLSDMNKNKVFNYLIQLMETESNMSMLTQLVPKIKDYKSKLILYSYDSFLFDFHIKDGLDFIKMVKATIEQKGKYPVKVAKGWNYHEMKDITRKFK